MEKTVNPDLIPHAELKQVREKRNQRAAYQLTEENSVDWRIIAEELFLHTPVPTTESQKRSPLCLWCEDGDRMDQTSCPFCRGAHTHAK